MDNQNTATKTDMLQHQEEDIEQDEQTISYHDLLMQSICGGVEDPDLMDETDLQAACMLFPRSACKK